MRAVVQRVTRARVSVLEADDDGEPGTLGRVIGEIGVGLVALVGVGHGDGPAQATAMAAKLYGLRILRGQLSVADVADAAILVVSQFTLYGDARKGRRPSWNAAAAAAIAAPLIDEVADHLRGMGAAVQTGEFGARMSLELTNDGPVTVILDF